VVVIVIAIVEVPRHRSSSPWRRWRSRMATTVIGRRSSLAWSLLHAALNEFLLFA